MGRTSGRRERSKKQHHARAFKLTHHTPHTHHVGRRASAIEFRQALPILQRIPNRAARWESIRKERFRGGSIPRAC